MSLTSMYLRMTQKSIDTFSAQIIANCYNIHWLIYRVGLRMAAQFKH